MRFFTWLRNLFSSLTMLKGRKATRSSHRQTQSPIGAIVQQLEPRLVLSALSVTTTADSGTGSLRAAIIQANTDAGTTTGPDTITFTIPTTDPNYNPATKSWTIPVGVAPTGPGGALVSDGLGELYISGSMSIWGLGANQLAIDGEGLNRVFEIAQNPSSQAASPNVTIAGLTIQHGNAAAGGGIFNGGNLTLQDNVITNNTANGTGGTYALGGGIFNYGTLTTGALVPSAYVTGSPPAPVTTGTPTSSGNTISNNSAFGGSSVNMGGGIFNQGTGRVGTGILVSNGDTISGNTVIGGGVTGGIVAIGAGILNNNGDGATATAPTNGISTLTNDTIANNTASGGTVESAGGGIANNAAQSLPSTMTLVNDTITGNSAVSNPTTVGFAAAGGILDTASLSAVNTIVALNTGGDIYQGAPGANPKGTFNATYTLVGDTSPTAGLTSGGASHNIINPSNQNIFQPTGLPNNVLPSNDGSTNNGNNGGFTNTFALAAGSPAIGVGNLSAQPGYDETGFRAGSNDLGARSSQHSNLSVNQPTDDTKQPTVAYLTLRNAINEANPDVYPVGNTAGDFIQLAFSLLFPPGSTTETPVTITLTQGQLTTTGSMTIFGLGYKDGVKTTPWATISGGGQFRDFETFTSSANVTIEEVGLTGGNAAQGGGAVYNAGGTALNTATGSLTLIDNYINANTAVAVVSVDSGGGGIFNYYGNLNSTNNLITANKVVGGQNTKDLGGAICNYGGNFTTTSDDITGNSVAGTQSTLNAGGGIFNYYPAGATLQSSGVMSILSDTISGNTVGGNATADFGAGVANFGVLTSLDNTFTGNQVSGGNGGAFYNAAVMTSTNDTIDGNSAAGVSTLQAVAGAGGGIFDGFSSFSALPPSLVTTNDTIKGNTAVAGGGVGVYGTTWNSLNTIVAKSGGGDVFSQNGTVNAFNTLVGDTSPSAGLSTGVNGNIVNPVDQNIFGPGLGSYGGPNNTDPLALGSPAIGTAGSMGTVTADNGTTLSVSNITFIIVGDFLRIGTGANSEIVAVTGITAGIGTTGTLTVLRARDLTTQINLSGLTMSLSTDETGKLVNSNDMGARSSQHDLVVTLTSDGVVAPSPGDTDTFLLTTLRDAINVATFDVFPVNVNTGDTITFSSAISGQTIAMDIIATPFSIKNSMKIDGGTNNITIQGIIPIPSTSGGLINTNIFTVASSAMNVIINNLTLTGGASNSGGAIQNSGTLTLTNDTITGNLAVFGTTANEGGAIANINGGVLTINNCTITGNQAEIYPVINPVPTQTSPVVYTYTVAPNLGGGIYNNNSTLTINNSTIADNVAGDTPLSNTKVRGLSDYGPSSNFPLLDFPSSLPDGTVNAGGGIYVDGGTVTINNSAITGNQVIGNASRSIDLGGGIEETTGSLNASLVTLNNDTIAYNQATGSGNPGDQVRGGGVDSAGVLTTTNDTFAANSLTGGGTVSEGGGIFTVGEWNSMNSILATNSSGLTSGVHSDDVYNELAAGTTTNVQYTLIGPSSPTSGITNGLNGNVIYSTVQNIFNGGLSPVLADNVPTTYPFPLHPDSIELATNSPAIAAGGVFGTVTQAIGNVINVTNVTFITAGDDLTIGTEHVLVQSVTQAATGTSGTLVIVPNQDGTSTAPLLNQQVSMGKDQNGTIRTYPDLGSVATQKLGISSANATTFIAGQSNTFTITPVGLPAPLLTESGALPAGVAFTFNYSTGTGTLSGTPALGSGGIYTLTFTASYTSTVTYSQTFTLTVDQAPAITSAANTTFVSGQPNSFQVTTTGYPAPTFTISGAPTGVSIDPTTGVLSGNPPSSVSGTYHLTITASNGVATPASQSFTLTVNQAATFTSAASVGFIAGAGGTFQVTAIGVPTPTLAETTANPTGVTFNASTGILSVATTTSPGNYHLTFTASNLVGTATQNFTLNVGQAPAITSAAGATFTVGTNSSFTVTASGNPTPVINYTGTLPSGLTFVNGAFTGTPAAGTGGVYNLTITASNGVGAPATQNFTLTVNQGAAITSAASASFITGTGGTFTVTATGSPVPTLSETASLPFGVTFNSSTGVLSVAPNALPGTYSLVFKATNNVGAATQNFTLNINQPPAITSVASTTFTVGTSGSFQVTTTGFPVPTVNYTGVLPAGLTFNNGLLSGTPAAGTGGIYTVTFVASNNVGTVATQTFTLTVLQAAAITSPPSKVVQLGVASTFTVTTSGFPAPTLWESATLPTGVTFNAATGVLSISAKVPLGSYQLTFNASNNVGSVATQNFTLFVGQAPAITSANRTTFAVGTAGSFIVTTNGFPAATVTESGNLPNGVTFNSSTGVLSGTPQPLSGGVYSLTLTANNGIGTVATQTFTLFVDERPSFTSANSTSFVVGQPGRFAVTVAGFPAPSLSETGALPNGITFNSATGILSGTPTAGAVGTFHIVFTASSKLYGNVTQNFTLTINPAPLALFALKNNLQNDLNSLN